MRLATILVLIAASAALTQPARAQAPAPSAGGWVGKRVITVYGTVLNNPKEGVDDADRSKNLAIAGRDRRAEHIYKVEFVNGPWLWLVEEKGTAEGWVDAAYVIPHDQAIEYFTAQIRANPASSIDYSRRAGIWKEKGELDIAIADYNESIRLDPTSETAFNNRGGVWAAKKEYDKAIADYSESIRLDPRHLMAYRNRGLTWSDKKEYDKAIADYSDAIRLDPKDTKAYDYRGDAWYAKKEYDIAIADYTEAIRIDPKYAVAYVDRGNARYAKKDYEKAIADHTEAIKIDPKSARAYDNRGDARRAMKDYDAAIADYSEAIRVDPKFKVAYVDRGNTYSAKKEYDKAVADFGEAIRLDPKDAASYNERAWLRATCPEAKIRDGKAAVDDATRACELTEWKAANDLDTLAASHAEAGDFARAVEFQEKAIALLKSEPNAEEYRERLALYKQKKPYRNIPAKAVAAAPAPRPEPPVASKPAGAKLNATRLYLPTSEIEARFGADAKPMGDYVNALKARLNAILGESETPTAAGLLVAVGLKEGRRARVWCQAVEGEVAPALIRTLEAELAQVPAPELKRGPAGFALEFALGGRKPATFPEFPDRWRDAAASSRSKALVPPDDLFRLIWPD